MEYINGYLWIISNSSSEESYDINKFQLAEQESWAGTQGLTDIVKRIIKRQMKEKIKEELTQIIKECAERIIADARQVVWILLSWF